MGHADRPRFHNALSLDAQSRSVRLSLAGGRRHSHSNTYRDPNGNSHCDGNGNGYYDPNSNTWSQVHSHTEATPHSTAASLSPDLLMIREEVISDRL